MKDSSKFPAEQATQRDVRGKKTANPGYQPGNHWVECQICACAIRTKDAKTRWDGLIVCPDDWDTRNPQDFVRGREEDTSAKGIVNPETEGTFVQVTRLPASSTTPAATNNNDL